LVAELASLDRDPSLAREVGVRKFPADSAERPAIMLIAISGDTRSWHSGLDQCVTNGSDTISPPIIAKKTAENKIAETRVKLFANARNIYIHASPNCETNFSQQNAPGNICQLPRKFCLIESNR